MARVGFKIAKYNLHDKEAGKLKTLTGNSVPVFEKVIDEKFSPNYANAELYANDGLAEHDDSFIDGALNITIADDEDKFVATIFGQTITTEGEVTSNENDIAPELSYGHIVPKMYNGSKKYKVEFFPRVRFTKITSDNKTKGQSIEFNTSSLEGKVMRLEKAFNGLKEGDWEKHQTFDTLSAATTYLDGLLSPSA